MQNQCGKSRGSSNSLQAISTEEKLAYKKPQASKENQQMLSQAIQGNARNFDSSEESDDKGNSNFSQIQNSTIKNNQELFLNLNQSRVGQKPDESMKLIKRQLQLLKTKQLAKKGPTRTVIANNQEQERLFKLGSRESGTDSKRQKKRLSTLYRPESLENTKEEFHQIFQKQSSVRLTEDHLGTYKSKDAPLPEGHNIDKVITRQKKRAHLNSRGDKPTDKKAQKSTSLQQLPMHQPTSQVDLNSNYNIQYKKGQNVNQMKKQYSKEDIGRPLDSQASSSRVKKKPTIMLPKIRANMLSQSPKNQTALVNPNSLVPLSPHTMEPIEEEQSSQFVAKEQARLDEDQSKSQALQKQPKHQYMSKIPDKNSQTGDQISNHKLRRESSTLPQLHPNSGTKNVISHNKPPETKQQYQINNLKQANQQIVKLRRELSVKNAQLSQILKGYGTNTVAQQIVNQGKLNKYPVLSQNLQDPSLIEHASQVSNRDEKQSKGQSGTTTFRVRQPSETKSKLKFMKRAVSQPDCVLYHETEQGQIRNQQRVKVETNLQNLDKVRSATACQDGFPSQDQDQNNIFIYSPLGNNNFIQPFQFQETKLATDQKHPQQQQQQKNSKDLAAFQQEGNQLTDYSKQKPLSQVAPGNNQVMIKGKQTVKKCTIKLPKVDSQEALQYQNQAQMLQAYQGYAQVHQQQLQFQERIQTDTATQNRQFEYTSQILNKTQQSQEKEAISSPHKASISQNRDLKQPTDRSEFSQTSMIKSQSNRTLKLKLDQITRKQSEAVQDRQIQPKETTSVDKSTSQTREQELLKQSTKPSKTSIYLNSSANQQLSTTCHEDVPKNCVLPKISASPHYSQKSQENIRDKALNCNYQQLHQFTGNPNDHQMLFYNQKQQMFYPQHHIPRDYQTVPINPNEEDDELCNYEVNSQAPSNSFRNVLRDSHHIVIIDDKADDDIPSSACESRIEEFHID